MNSDIFPKLPTAQRQMIADRWFAVMFGRFTRQPRLAFGSDLAEEADKLCAKLRTAVGQLTFQRVLLEISGFIALSSQSRAQDYFDFWDAVVNRRDQVFGKTGS